LSGVLNSIESSGAHNGANASHKASNPWYKAFHSIYGGVASDCSVPTGKNRYHKFKDKIVELWVAMEQAGAHPLKDMGVRQYNAYKQALDTRPPAPNGDSPSKPAAAVTDKAGTTGTEISPKPAAGAPKSTLVVKRPPTMNTVGLSKAVTNTAGAAVGAAAKAMINNKRAASAVGGPMGSSNYPPPTQWLHLDEGAVLLRIPQPLQSLLHLRHMGVEVQSQDTVLVEEAYQRALNDFLDAPTLLTITKDSAAGEEKASGKAPGDLYALCQSMVLLWRCAKRLQKSQESKAILYTYHNIVQEYLQSIQQEHEQEQETDKETPSTSAVTEI
jgi:hypothetical protein